MEQNFGKMATNRIHKLYKDKRISVIMECQIIRMKGETKLEAIHFKKEGDLSIDKLINGESGTEFFIKPDVVIAENGLGKPKIDINKLID